MLLVIFGAGASYDSSSSHPASEVPGWSHRLPLANQLFSDRQEFVEDRKQFPLCLPVIPRLRQAGAGNAVERELARLQDEGKTDPERYRQIASVRYYLQRMLWNCEVRWGGVVAGVTNYKTLLDQIRHYRKHDERVCFVTFNYDRMLEEALPTIGVPITGLDGYIDHPTYKVMKVHGSVNWARKVVTSIERLAQIDDFDAARRLIELAPTLEISRRYVIVPKHSSGKHEAHAVYPAIAIPVEEKSEFECPENHLAALREFLPDVTKLLLIGWRATEAHFLQELRQHIKRPLQVLIVSGRRELAEEPRKNLESLGLAMNVAMASGGFTEFVLGDEVTAFLTS